MALQNTEDPGQFDTNLLLYYLSGMSRGFGGEGGVGDIIGGMTQQHIRSRSQMEFIKQLLKGGGKVNLDRDNVSIKAPIAAFKERGGMGGVGPGLEDTVTPAPVAAPAPAVAPTPTSTGALNPSGALPLDDVSLAGLTSEDISQAFQLKLGAEELERKKFSDLMTYAGLARKDTRPSAVKVYEYYVAQTEAAGETPMGIEEWQKGAETTHWRDYQKYVGQEKEVGTPEKEIQGFNDWLLAFARAGGINLGDLRAREVVKDEVASEEYFTSPKFSKDIDKWINQSEQRLQYEGADDRDKKKAFMTKNWIEGKITSSGGRVTNVKMDGRTMVWTVTFKSGITKEVRYAF